MSETKPANASEVTIVTTGQPVPNKTEPAMPTGVVTAVTTPASNFAFFGTRVRETLEAFKEAF